MSVSAWTVSTPARAVKKEIVLPQLGDDLFRRLLLPWHVLILLDAIRHTSSRTTISGGGSLWSVRSPWVSITIVVSITIDAAPLEPVRAYT